MKNIKEIINYPKKLLKWICLAFIVGTVGGVLGSWFHLSIDEVTHLRSENPRIIFLLPLGGLVIALLYRLSAKKGKIDTNRVITAAKSDEKVPFVMIPLIFISTVLTHFFGGSAGREGAALQLGGSIGYNTGRLFKLNKTDMNIIVMAGMSGVFAALFGTPLTASVFAMEVIFSGVFHYSALVACVISAIVASQIALNFGISPVSFDINFLNMNAELFIKSIILAVLLALVSIVFCVVIKECKYIMKRFIPNSYLRIFSGGILIVLLTLLCQTNDYNGAGMEVIQKAMNGQVRYEAFILKIIFTALTIGAGFKGGEIVPAFFVGSTFGCFAGDILGIDSGFSAALGFIGVFCGVTNCPLSSIILAFEVFGGGSMIAFALVCAVSYMMSGYFGLYGGQKFILSKLDNSEVNINAK